MYKISSTTLPPLLTLCISVWTVFLLRLLPFLTNTVSLKGNETLNYFCLHADFDFIYSFALDVVSVLKPVHINNS